MIPLRRNSLEYQSKWRGLSGRKRSDSQIHWLGIRAIVPDHLERNFVALRNLPGVIFEGDFDHHMRHRLDSGICDGPVDVADGRANKIFRRAHLEIRKL